MATLVERTEAALGPLGVLVNNASTFERDEWQDATRESWDRHMEPNLRAPFLLTQQDFRASALPPEAAKGVVVNMIDQRVWSLTPHFVSYTVTQVGALDPDAHLGAGARTAHPRGRDRAGPRRAEPPADPGGISTSQCSSVPLQPRHVTRGDRGGRDGDLCRCPRFTGQMLALDGGQHLQWGAFNGEIARMTGTASVPPLRRVFVRDLVLAGEDRRLPAREGRRPADPHQHLDLRR